MDYLPKTAQELADDPKPEAAKLPVPSGAMCRALSTRMDPEELKEMGNEDYKNGRYADAIALYDRAILIDPEKASYWSNKAAALIGLGQLLEAVGECREAVRLDPSYYRAHHRLATLYHRLGEPEKASHHYKLSRNEASADDVSKVQALQSNIAKCNEARRMKDWNTVLKAAESAISAGADSAPQVFAAKAEALLLLRRQEEADTTFSLAPKFDIEASTKFFGATNNAYFHSVRAQIAMSAGKFEDAVSISQRAARLDPSSREVSVAARKSRVVASARSRGNELFKASKFQEACIAYGEGLENDSHNAILLCNRAACRAKLGQLEKAIEDCNVALSMRSSYSKARLRRADCNAKLGRWEASLQDYEALLRQMPNDEEVNKGLQEAQAQLKKQQCNVPVLVHVTTKYQFKQAVSSTGLSVVLFFDKPSQVSGRLIPLMEQLSKQYPSMNFLKVNTEEVPDLMSECLSSVPCFKIYQNGSGVKDIGGSDHENLESSIKSFNR